MELKRRFVSAGPALLVLATSAAALVAVPATIRRAGFAQTEGQVVLARQSLDEDDILERLNRAVREVATSVEPSVVHIEVVSRFNPDGEPGERFPFGSSGSGWVFDADGHILTNAHVVRAARDIRVQFFDGRASKASILGSDPFSDIAVLKVEEKEGLVPARRATDEPPSQGDRVYAFGSPFGFKFSMSEGIVSGLGRSARAAAEFGGFTNFIQTDAAVNPGNSGGPLVDIRGRVIGMNVAIATARETDGTNEGQSAGISFAIPLATIESVAEQLVSKGSVSRGFLGVSFASGRQSRPVIHGGKFIGLGVAVRTVEAQGPSAAAGLLPGDVIMEIGGNRVSEPEVLRATISAYRPGKAVPLRVWRESEFVDLTVILGERPAASLAIEASYDIQVKLGLRLSSNAQVARVVQVEGGSPAERRGIKEGDEFVKVAGLPVSEQADLFAQLVENGLLQYTPVTVTLRDRDGTERDLALILTR